jgi:hypothetical protein
MASSLDNKGLISTQAPQVHSANVGGGTLGYVPSTYQRHTPNFTMGSNAVDPYLPKVRDSYIDEPASLSYSNPQPFNI